MGSEYRYLRVEESLPVNNAVAMAPTNGTATPSRRPSVRLQPNALDELAQARRDVEYYRGEMKRAVKEREEIKQSLEHKDGAAAFWRRQAKVSSQQLAQAHRRVDTMRAAVEEQRGLAIKFSEESDTLKAQLARLKRGLWDIWSELEDLPLKQRLWAIWAGL